MRFVVSFLLIGPCLAPVSACPKSPEISASATFFKLLPRARLHLGFISGLLTLIALWFFFSRPTFGLKMRATGLGKEAARFAGINVNRTIILAALISGGIAGLAGVGAGGGVCVHPHASAP